MLSTILKLFISSVLLIGMTIQANDQIGHQERDLEDPLFQESTISEIPYGHYFENFQPDTYKIFDNLDLSEYEHKRLFVGYGVFDKEEKFCKYVDFPENVNFNDDFLKWTEMEDDTGIYLREVRTGGNNFLLDNPYKVYNDQTYAISKNKMDYLSCLSLVNKYQGYIYFPKNATENIYLTKIFANKYDVWIGMKRDDCSSNYKNELGNEQSYSNFEFQERCDENKKVVYSKEGKNPMWYRASTDEQHYCMIQLQSPDYKRPLKVCSSWWNIERKIQNPTYDPFIFKWVSNDGVQQKWDLRAINQARMPIKMAVCSQYEESVYQAQEEQGTRKTTCVDYYSMNAGQQCLYEPVQASCKINECRGYVENNCNLIERFAPYKDYTWGYVQRNGAKVRVKVKQGIKTNVYECPKSPPSARKCIKKEQVLVFPKECPGESFCDEQSECLKTRIESGKTIQECVEEFPCKLQYGSTDSIFLNPDGSLRAIGIKCER